MLTTELIHPQIMAALAHCGHGSKILIADANYPLQEKTADAQKIYLGLRRGMPTVIQVLEAMQTVVKFEKAEVMIPEEGAEPEIFTDFRSMLGMELSGMGRYEFYDACTQPGAVALAISTGEQRTFANLLLTVGCS